MFYPLHIKIPLEAAASILVVVLAVYVFKATEPEIQLLRAPSESVSPIPKDFAYRDKGKGVASVPAAPTAPITPQNLETKTATGGRLEKDQDPHQLSGSGALRDNKMEEPGPPVAPLKKMEPSESKPAPAPRAAVKEKDRAQPGVVESREAKGKSSLDSSTVGQTAVYKSAPIGITLQVRDVREAAKKALDLLQQAGVRNVQTETTETIEIITAAVASQSIPNLLDQLNTLGKVHRRSPLPTTQEEPVSIRIEIIRFIP